VHRLKFSNLTHLTVTSLSPFASDLQVLSALKLAMVISVPTKRPFKNIWRPKRVAIYKPKQKPRKVAPPGILSRMGLKLEQRQRKWHAESSINSENNADM